MSQENKFFYEITKGSVAGNPYILLSGPLDGIQDAKIAVGGPDNPTYAFVQVVNEKVVQAFTKEEIIVTDRIL